MNTEFLDEFTHLASSLSFRQTAAHFYVSRSVISRHMAALEETLGARLFKRDSRGVELTEAGKVFYREAKTILRDWDLALNRVRSVEEAGKSLVRIGYLRNGARPFLVNFVNHMAQIHPEINLSVLCMEYDELYRALQEHAVDIAVAINVNPSISNNYRSTLIYQDCFYVLCPHNHELAQKTKISLMDLQNQKLLVPDSYIYAGLGSSVSELVDDEALKMAQSIYRDIDMLYLKIQTEDYLAFVSGLNMAIFGDMLAHLPLEGIDTSFSVSAFYHDELSEQLYQACVDGFEWCRSAMKEGRKAHSLEYNML